LKRMGSINVQGASLASKRKEKKKKCPGCTFLSPGKEEKKKNACLRGGTGKKGRGEGSRILFDGKGMSFIFRRGNKKGNPATVLKRRRNYRSQLHDGRRKGKLALLAKERAIDGQEKRGIFPSYCYMNGGKGRERTGHVSLLRGGKRRKSPYEETKKKFLSAFFGGEEWLRPGKVGPSPASGKKERPSLARR